MLPFRFYLITDRLGAAGDPLPLLPALAAGGLRALQVREKDLSPAQLHAYGRRVRDALGEAGAGVAVFLNDRADLAMSLGLAGAHLREDSLPLADQPQVFRRALLFGVSTHTLDGVLAAEAAEADFATFGPVYPTASKAAWGDPVGLKGLRQAAANSRLPLLALGGVTPERVAECIAAGAHGVAAISAVWGAPEPVAALAAFREALGEL